jgi:microcystin-dependent protein
MADPFLGEIRLVSFNFPPKGWALCNGQLLSIAQNQALFALLGTAYGGNGIQNFQLPNYQARMPVHIGNGYVQGQLSGEPTHTLIQTEMPLHTHSAVGVSINANNPSASGNAWASSGQNPYAASPNTQMSPSALTNAGGSQPHDNMPPYLTLNFIIALTGIFPSRN